MAKREFGKNRNKEQKMKIYKTRLSYGKGKNSETVRFLIKVIFRLASISPGSKNALRLNFPPKKPK